VSPCGAAATWWGDSAEVRDPAGVAAGDGLDVDLELDAAPREVTAPPDLAAGARLRSRGAALLREPVVQQQRWFVDGSEQAAKPETRQRRVAGAVARLHEGHGQR
jgi:hypothetical protein